MVFEQHVSFVNISSGHVMPIQYPEGLMKEHFACRENAAVFDVSHMAQLKYTVGLC